jgi:hypothetical protein
MCKLVFRILTLAIVLMGASLVVADELIVTSVIFSTVVMAGISGALGWARAERTSRPGIAGAPGVARKPLIVGRS